MSDNDDNPFRAPASDTGYSDGTPFDVSSGPMRVDGKMLVIKSGTVLPRFCVRTNVPIPDSNLRSKTLTWCPPFVFIFFLFGGLLAIIAYLIMRKTCKVTYGLSDETQRKYRTRLIVKLLVTFALLCAIPLLMGYNDVVSTVVIVSFVVSLIVLFVGNAPLAVTNHVKGEFWISGCSSEYLARVTGESEALDWA